MSVRLVVPSALAPDVGGQRAVVLQVEQPATLADLLALLARDYPRLHRRVVDETGSLRRFVNVFINDEECRRIGGLRADVPAECEVCVLGSIAGG